ncbi:MAG: hypothetical protein ACLP4R_00010 [Solirubrobacteraceae bacterium]
MSPKRQDASLFCGGFDDIDRLDRHVRAILAVRGDEHRELSPYSVVSGHFSLSTLLRITSPSSIAIVLREPRARVLSHYAFWRLSSSVRTAWRGYPALDHALRPLNEFLAEPQVAQASDNVVCRMLLGEDPDLPELGFIAPEQVDYIASRAIAALESLGFVGVLELGDSIWSGLSRFFEVSLTPMRLNTAGAEDPCGDAPDVKLEITARTLDLLYSRTAADAIVYRHAMESQGYSRECADRLSAAAFADELVRLGNVADAAASDLRRRLRQKDVETEHCADLLRRTQETLDRREAELAQTRGWLEALQRSTSWRITAPVRAAKRTLRKPRT